MDWQAQCAGGHRGDRFAAAVERTTDKIVRAYGELSRLMAHNGCTLEDLQGAAEFLLDALRDARRNANLRAQTLGRSRSSIKKQL
jgi:hypothetical protein